jgi:xanthine dehydrogenase accessory factor
MQEIAEAVRRSDGRAVVARVIGLKGFSTLPVDELVVIDREGRQEGDLLGRPGATRLAASAGEMLAAESGPSSPRIIEISIHGKEVDEIGLSCGGQAEVLMQRTASIPDQLWSLLADRAPVALITPLGGAQPTVVDGEGNSWGPASSDHVVEAGSMLAARRSDRQRLEEAVLIEAWVPQPRLVVVGAGDVVSALSDQAGLLGWEMQSANDSSSVPALLDWAGATAALVVLSHDPHVDVPALTSGLERGVGYVGAMGSRSTQSRRLTRLEAAGVEGLDRIHRPIGLNLGGRRAAEVALAIVAEILACHYGRDARSLRDTSGPIHAAS